MDMLMCGDVDVEMCRCGNVEMCKVLRYKT